MFPVGNPVALEFHRDPLLSRNRKKYFRQPVLRHSAGKGEAEFSIIGNRPCTSSSASGTRPRGAGKIPLDPAAPPGHPSARYLKMSLYGRGYCAERSSASLGASQTVGSPAHTIFLVPHSVGDRLLQALLHDLFVHLAAHRLQDLRKLSGARRSDQEILMTAKKFANVSDSKKLLRFTGRFNAAGRFISFPSVSVWMMDHGCRQVFRDTDSHLFAAFLRSSHGTSHGAPPSGQREETPRSPGSQAGSRSAWGQFFIITEIIIVL